MARLKFDRYRNTHIFNYFRVSFDKLLFQGVTQINTYGNFFLLKYAGSYDTFFSLDIDILSSFSFFISFSRGLSFY